MYHVPLCKYFQCHCTELNYHNDTCQKGTYISACRESIKEVWGKFILIFFFKFELEVLHVVMYVLFISLRKNEDYTLQTCTKL